MSSTMARTSLSSWSLSTESMPTKVRSGAISVRLAQAPLTYAKKSSPGFTLLSIAVRSTPQGAKAGLTVARHGGSDITTPTQRPEATVSWSLDKPLTLKSGATRLAARSGRCQAHFDEWSENVLWRFGQRKGDHQPAQILAFVERDRPAIDFGDVADDGEAKAGARLAGRVEPLAAVNSSSRCASAMPGGPSSSIWTVTLPVGGSTVMNTRPWPYFAAFSTRLPSISSRSCRSTRPADPCLPMRSMVTFG